VTKHTVFQKKPGARPGKFREETSKNAAVAVAIMRILILQANGKDARGSSQNFPQSPKFRLSIGKIRQPFPSNFDRKQALVALCSDFGLKSARTPRPGRPPMDGFLGNCEGHRHERSRSQGS